MKAGELQLFLVSFPFYLCSEQHQQHRKGRNSHTFNAYCTMIAVAGSLAADKPVFDCFGAFLPDWGLEPLSSSPLGQPIF